MIKELYHLLKSCFWPRDKEFVFVLFVIDYAYNPVFFFLRKIKFVFTTTLKGGDRR